MAKYRGLADIYTGTSPGDTSAGSAVGSRAIGETFASIATFATSSYAQELGIELLAGNHGVNGTGFSYWDSPSPAGVRNFVVLRFHSASLGKFDCMLFAVTGSGNSISPMNIGSYSTTVYAQGNSSGYIGVSFAWHPSGSNVTQSDGPWNGTYSQTSASIGSPVWKLNSEQKGGFWPRANGIGGTHSGSRNYMYAHTVDNTTTTPAYAHFVFSEDSFTLLTDAPIDSNYRVMHFGPFLPRSGVNYDSHYFGWSTIGSEQPFAAFYASTLGTAVNPNTNIADGCISVPTLVSGARNMAFVAPGIDSNMSFNRWIESGSVQGGVWEKFPLWVALADSGLGTSRYGILGRMKHLYYGFGMTNMSVSFTSSSLAIGRTTQADPKLIMPWSGSAPGVGQTREGRVMSWEGDY